MLSGRMTLLGQEFSLCEVNWSLDPQSGSTAPMAFGPTLDYRDAGLAGNARNIWELNRHQHLTLAALAYALSGEERYADFVREQIDSWLDQNPFPLGVNWGSSLELGLRLISWVWISRFLNGSVHWDALFGEFGRLWPSVHRHQWMIAARRSVGSSANNHLIGEMAGLFVSAAEWPWFESSKAWSERARQSLETEIVKQFYPSGLNREQAFGYHVFATELLLMAGVEGQRAGRPFSRGYREKLCAATEAGVALVAPKGPAPTYGDSDDGVAVGLPGGGQYALERIVAVVGRWLTPVTSELPLPREAVFAANLELSGLCGAGSDLRRIPSSPTDLTRSRAFFDAGLFLMRSRAEGQDILVTADAGELGYLSIAAHGHADALSFTLAVEGEPLLIDPGTFAYHYDLKARAYFRGTPAHNTIWVDGADQSQPGGPFMWTRKARVTVQAWRPAADGGLLTASHDGYERLTRPVTHRRTLSLQGEQLCVDDELSGEGKHDIEWRLHVAPQCAVRLDGEECNVRGERHDLSIRLDGALQWRCMVGEESGGWFSGGFNRREKTTTIVGVARLPMPARLRHVVRVTS